MVDRLVLSKEAVDVAMMMTQTFGMITACGRHSPRSGHTVSRAEFLQAVDGMVGVTTNHRSHRAPMVVDFGQVS